MKKNFLLFLIIFTSMAINAQSWVWAKASNSASSGEGYGIATDPSGNVFICGIIYGPTISFGSATLSTSGRSYLAKYDASGNSLWARNITVLSTTTGATARAVAADNNGNSFLTGNFQGSISFGTYTLTSNGSYDTYLVKYDSNGIVLWAKSGGGSLNEGAVAVCVDQLGNSYITGSCGSSLAAWGTVTLSSTGPRGMLVKYDPMGNELWATMGLTSGSERGTAVSCDNSGNVFMAGGFAASSLTFGTVVIPNTGSQDFYVVKFNSAGTALWGASSSGAADEYALSASADPLGNVYVGGYFDGPNVTIGSQNYTVTNSSAFVVKYSSSGLPLWTNIATAAGGPVVSSLSAYQTGVFVTGNVGNGSLFSIGSYSFVPTYESIFVANYNAAGNLLYATTLPDGGDDEIDIASSGPCTAFIAGDYRSTQFVIGSNTLINNSGAEGIFTAKLSFSAAIGLSANTASINGAPNICLGQTATLIATGLSTYTWSNGSLVNYTYVTPTVNSTFSVNGTSACGIGTAAITITVNPLPSLSISASSNSVCAGSQVTLNASGANSYVWTGGLNNGAVYNPSTSTTYTVNGTDINNCTSTASITIQVVQYPTLGAIASPSIICAGDVATLTATGANSYTWQPTGSNTSTVLVTPSVSTTFSVIKANSDCANSSTVSVLVKNSPTLVLTPSASTICAGTTATLNVSGAITYSWSNFTTGPLTLVSPGSTTIYSVTGTDNIGTGCSSTSTVQVTVVICDGVLENEQEKTNVIVFPNPITTFLYVQFNKKLEHTQVIIYNSLGENIFHQDLMEQNSKVDLSGLPAGVYTYVLLQDQVRFSAGKLYIQE